MVPFSKRPLVQMKTTIVDKHVHFTLALVFEDKTTRQVTVDANLDLRIVSFTFYSDHKPADAEKEMLRKLTFDQLEKINKILKLFDELTPSEHVTCDETSGSSSICVDKSILFCPDFTARSV